MIGSDGKPAAGVEVKWEEDYGLWPSQTRPEITDAGGGFDLRGVEYPTPVAVAVDRQRKLKGHRITVAAPQGEVEIMLKPTGTLTGRVTDGKTPIPGAKAILFAQEATLPGSGANYSGVENAETDATGHYHFDLIEAGRAHLIRVSAEGYTESSSQFGLVVSPGEAVELPTMKLQQANMAVSGIVVDPRGNAVEGVTVSAEDRFTQQEIPLGYQPTTGKDGRFTITVPDLPLRLVAHVLYIQSSGTKPPPIFPAYADVKPGQTDVRIVFDPKVAAVLGKFPPPRPAPVAGKTP
ncbi:MAG: carboxypeptidase regulatory-like domain-containing protein [Thermoguttaceae bacterium]